MEHFWVVTHINDDDQLVRARYDSEDLARDFYNNPGSIFLDEVWRISSNI